jgi:IS5 family transposase
MAVPLQLGFTDYEQIYAKKKTRRQRFLEEMEITVPWEAFLALIEPVYHKPSSKGGRPPIPLEVMLRIHLLQQWFTLSDPLMEEMLIDTPCFRRFAGIETMEGRIPDETTILNFRHLLEEHRIAEQILEGVNQMLSERGAMPPVPRRTSERRGIPKCTRWPRASSGSLECAAILELMPHLAWSTPLRAPLPTCMN